MNLIDEKEIDRLLMWASENEDKSVFLSDKDNSVDTFWKTREREDTYIMVYDFKTIPEFEKVCATVFEKEYDREIQRIVSVAAFKNGQKCMGKSEREKATDQLPEYIYVF